MCVCARVRACVCVCVCACACACACVYRETAPCRPTTSIVWRAYWEIVFEIHTTELGLKMVIMDAYFSFCCRPTSSLSQIFTKRRCHDEIGLLLLLLSRNTARGFVDFISLTALRTYSMCIKSSSASLTGNAGTF